MDVTRFRRHISTSSYRPFVTVGNWPNAAFDDKAEFDASKFDVSKQTFD